VWSWDREKHRHNPPYGQLSRISSTKGLHRNSDAGLFRDPHSYTLWPDLKQVREVWEEEEGKGSGDLLFFPMWGPPHPSMQFWSEGMGPIDNEGSFFGGTTHTIKWWRSLYFDYHDHYLSLGIFIGKDQILIIALFLLNPHGITSVGLGDLTPLPPVPSTNAYTQEGYSEVVEATGHAGARGIIISSSLLSWRGRV